MTLRARRGMIAAMCGRFDQHRPPRELVRHYQLDPPALPNLRANYDVRPTQDTGVVAAIDGALTLRPMRWGIWYPWMEGKRLSTFNAKAETAPSSPLYGRLVRSSRCVVPADGWYEWTGKGEDKRRWYFRRPDGRPADLAGLWTVCDTDEGQLHSFTIITTEPTERARPYHNRMPLVLEEDLWEAWLDPKADAADILGAGVTTDLDIYEVARTAEGAAQAEPL